MKLIYHESYNEVQNDALRFAEVTQAVREAVNTHGRGDVANFLL